MRLPVGIDYRCALLGHGGIARSVRELVRALARRDDVELHLYGHSLAPVARADPLDVRARLHRLPIPSRALPWLARIGVGPEHLCGRVPLFHWTDYVFPPLVKARGIVTLHDLAFVEDEVYHGTRMSAELLRRCRAVAQASRVIVTPTHATKAAVVAHLGAPAERVHVVPFGADHVPRAIDAATAPPTLITIGTIEPRKNHVRLLAALRLLKAQRARLLVVGRVGWECEEAVAALRLAVAAGEIEWRESLDDRRLWSALAHAQALVYPSLLEGFGFPPLEAMALGVPVVAGDTPALREVLGDAAQFCDPREPAAIAAAIERVLRDARLRTQLIERGRARSAQLTWARAAEGYAHAYREALA